MGKALADLEQEKFKADLENQTCVNISFSLGNNVLAAKSRNDKEYQKFTENKFGTAIRVVHTK